IGFGRGPARVDLHVAADAPAGLLETLQERAEAGLKFPIVRSRGQENANEAHLLALLRAHREPRGRAPDQRDALPASHIRPQGSKPRTASSHSRLGPGMGQRGCELRPIVLVWECRLWIPRPGQNRKSSESANAFRFAPESGTNLPILELLPPPAFCERG